MCLSLEHIYIYIYMNKTKSGHLKWFLLWLFEAAYPWLLLPTPLFYDTLTHGP